jgi:hypothetical protein
MIPMKRPRCEAINVVRIAITSEFNIAFEVAQNTLLPLDVVPRNRSTLDRDGGRSFEKKYQLL